MKTYRNALFCSGLILLGYLLSLWFPWWVIGPLAALMAWLLTPRPGLAFILGLISGFLLWAGYSFILNSQNQGLLATQIGTMFGGLTPWALIIVSGLTGGLFTACWSWFGSSIKFLIPHNF